jgi:germination protein M
MNRPSPIRHRRPFIVSIAIVLFVAACAAGSGDLGGVATPPPIGDGSPDVPTVAPTTESGSPVTLPESTPAGSPTGTTVVRAYFFLGSLTGNAGLVPVEREIAKTPAVGAASLSALLTGPIDAELTAHPAMYTSVPSGTRFLGLQVSGGVATINVSGEFEAGGDTASIQGRIAQVVYTLTQFPTVNGVRFEFDGVRPKTVFIGSFGRADYTSFLPAIFVDRPAWGGTVGSPVRVAGMANVFEATFRIAILDAAGKVLVDQQAMASCGTGCWGTFDVTIPYHVVRAQLGMLRVYDLSAKDGSRENLTEYPVTLTPGG